MTNFEIVTQNAETLDDFISAVVDDALEAKGCSFNLKLPDDDSCYGLWKIWLEKENVDEEICFPNGTCIERWRKIDG